MSASALTLFITLTLPSLRLSLTTSKEHLEFDGDRQSVNFEAVGLLSWW
ncbi:hypothetical protein IQ225_01240 [Synechocystis salina LEGE 06155]|nr:hypothetical protein [Synechocystis salina LEGE 06155]